MPDVTIDGIALDDPAGRWWVSDKTPETTVPSLVVTSLTGPDMVGEIDAPFPGYGAAVWPLVIAYKATNYGQAQAARAVLETAVLTRHRLLEVVMSSASWSRRCHGRVVAAEAERLAYGNRIDVTYQLRIPAGRWFDAAETAVELASGLRVSGSASDGVYVLGPLVGGSRDMDPVIETVGDGASTDVTVTDVTSGQWVRFAGNVAAGAPVVIDPVALSATANGARVDGLLDFSPREFHLSPSATVRLQRNGVQPVTITARRAYT